MACNKCYKNSCTGKCSNSSISRQIKIQNNSIGRDGESAYQLALRMGFIGTEIEFNELNLNNSYSTDNWT